MAVLCHRCGREYDITLFGFGRSVECDCGAIVTPGADGIWENIRKILAEAEQEQLDLLRREVDRVCSLIVTGRSPRVDVEIEIEKVRRLCRELFPRKEGLFDLIYMSRFQRLWKQFRGPENPPE